MGLIDSGRIVRSASAGGYAVPAFNTQGGNYDICRAIVDTCEEESSPVILMAYEKNLEYLGLDGFIAVAGYLAAKAAVPVALHLDHSSSVEVIKKAVDAGFTSVMIDYSQKPIEENIEATNAVLDYLGNDRSVSVEAEVGELQRNDVDSEKFTPKNLVDPATVKHFLDHAAPDMLAIGIGNAHGYYKGKPNIRIDLLMQVKEVARATPLVLHGSTGIPEDTVRRCIGLGIAKVNFGTLIRHKYMEYYQAALQEEHSGHSWKVAQRAMKSLKDDIRTVVHTCGSGEKA